MALPTLTNLSIGSIPNTQLLAARPKALTAYVTVNTAGTATTCNLSTDTFIMRADGGIWDDTCSSWISVDITAIRPTPRTQDQN